METLTALNKISDSDFWNAGYCASPNNIFSLPGRNWYPQYRYAPRVQRDTEIRLVDGELQLWTSKAYPRGDGFVFYISGIVTTFTGIEDFKNYIALYGITTAELEAEPGYNGPWD